MKIAFIGYGNVGAPLASHLQHLGHEVTLAANDPSSESVTKALAKNGDLKVAAPKEAVRAAQVAFLATPFQANADALKAVAEELKGKILVDCTNPVGAGFTHALNNVESGSEMVQKLVPETEVVKAFTIYGFENFEENAHPANVLKPVMMYCGRDAGAKKTVGELIEQLGWEPLDVGDLQQALHLEHMTLLWVRMVRISGYSPNLVWARLKR